MSRAAIAELLEGDASTVSADRLCVVHLGRLLEERLPARTVGRVLGAWESAVRVIARRAKSLADKSAAGDHAVGDARHAPFEAVERLVGGHGGGRAPR